MEVIWNEVSSATIPEFYCGKVTRSIVGEHRGTMVPIPGRDGAWYFPEERGRRLITLQCWVMIDEVDPISRRDAFREVADWLDVNQEAKLELADMPGKYYMGVLMDPPEPDEWREVGTFDLEFSVQPYAYSDNATSIQWDVNQNDSWTYDFDIVAATYPIIEVTNMGASSIDGMILGINDAFLSYAGSIGVGQTITINSIGMAVLVGTNDDVMLTGVYDPGDLIMATVSGSFPILMPGVNDLSVAGSDATDDLRVKIYYRKRYRD